MPLDPVDVQLMCMLLTERLCGGMPPELAAGALCSGSSHDVAAGGSERVAAAVATCARCPVLDSCRAWSYALPAEHRASVVLAAQQFNHRGQPVPPPRPARPVSVEERRARMREWKRAQRQRARVA